MHDSNTGKAELPGRHKSRLPLAIGYAYIMLPFIIFAFGYLKTIYAVPIVTCICIAYVLMIRHSEPITTFGISRKNCAKMGLAIVIIMTALYFSGIGGYSFQNADHLYRNQIFHLLVDSSWPVMDSGNTGNAMVYYIGYWLPSAMMGKLFGLATGYFFQYIWAAFGILLIYYFICSWQNGIKLWPLFILLFFSGLDIIGAIIFSLPGFEGLSLTLTSHIECWARYFQYSSDITQTYWVFNQSIPIWCIMMLLLLQKNSKNYVAIISTAVLTSSLPFIGAVPVLLLLSFSSVKNDNSLNRRLLTKGTEIWNSFKTLFSFQNIVGGGIIGLISYAYLSANNSGRHFSLLFPTEVVLFLFAFFIFFEAGIYLLCIVKDQKKNALFWLTAILLLICPWIRIGDAYDFAMRGSIPALFLLMLLVVDTMNRFLKRRNIKAIMVLIVVLTVGAVTPSLEISRSVINTASSLSEYGSVQMGEIGTEAIFSEPNFCGSTEDSFFFKYLAK